MLEQWGRYWWMLAVRGAVAIAFGLVAWIWPGITVWALIVVFGVYALVDGAVSIIHAVRGGAGQSRLWLGLSGLAGIGAGVIALVWPGVTGLVLLFVIAAWAVVSGVFEVAAAVALRRELDHEWLYVVSGALSVLFGVLLFVWPASGALAVIWLIGLSAIVLGVSLLGIALRVRRLSRRSSSRSGRSGTSGRPAQGGTATTY